MKKIVRKNSQIVWIRLGSAMLDNHGSRNYNAQVLYEESRELFLLK